jgi:hypothetical protein
MLPATQTRISGRDGATAAPFEAVVPPLVSLPLAPSVTPPAVRGEPEVNLLFYLGFSGAPYGNRTRVSAVKGRCPRPLDEGRNCLAAEKPAQSARDIKAFAKRRKSRRKLPRVLNRGANRDTCAGLEKWVRDRNLAA